MRAAQNQIDAVRDAAAAAPITDAQRVRIEEIIANGMTGPESFDMRCVLQRYEVACRDLHSALAVKP